MAAERLMLVVAAERLFSCVFANSEAFGTPCPPRTSAKRRAGANARDARLL